MRATVAEFHGLTVDYQPYLGAVAGKMSEERGGEARTGFEPFGNNDRFTALLGGDLFTERDRAVIHFEHERVENDRRPLFILGGEFADGELPGACCCFPVDPAEIILRLVIAQSKQVLAGAAFARCSVAEIERHALDLG